jgi:dihydroorotase-like cyclic amidohydrolase
MHTPNTGNSHTLLPDRKASVREPAHAEALWEALLDGTIDILSTDHAPHLPEEKRRASIWACAGIPGACQWAPWSAA